MRGIIALALISCAYPAPAPVVDTGDVPESPQHMVGRMLCDACTSSPTDEECIAHAEFILERCRAKWDSCLRKACVKLDDEKPGHFVPTAAVSNLPAVLIACRFGGVHRGDGAIATGNSCVLHDRNGATTAEALVVYDAGEARP